MEGAAEEVLGVADPPLPKAKVGVATVVASAAAMVVVVEEDERGDAEEDEENKDEKDGAAFDAAGAEDAPNEGKEGAALLVGVDVEEVNNGEEVEKDGTEKRVEDAAPNSGEEAVEEEEKGEEPRPKRGADAPDPKEKLGFEAEDAVDDEEAPKAAPKRGLGVDIGAAEDEEEGEDNKEMGLGVEEAVEGKVPREKPAAGDEEAAAMLEVKKLEAEVIEEKGDAVVEEERENGEEEAACGVGDWKAAGKENEGVEADEAMATANSARYLSAFANPDKLGDGGGEFSF